MSETDKTNARISRWQSARTSDGQRYYDDADDFPSKFNLNCTGQCPMNTRELTISFRLPRRLQTGQINKFNQTIFHRRWLPWLPLLLLSDIDVKVLKCCTKSETLTLRRGQNGVWCAFIHRLNLFSNISRVANAAKTKSNHSSFTSKLNFRKWLRGVRDSGENKFSHRCRANSCDPLNWNAIPSGRVRGAWAMCVDGDAKGNNN